MNLFNQFEEKSVEIEHLTLPEGEVVNYKPSENEIWIVSKGSFSLFLKEKKEYGVQSGQVFCLPRGNMSHILVHHSMEAFRFCVSNIESLLEKVFSKELFRKRNFLSDSFNTLEMTPALWEYTRHLSVVLQHPVCSPSFKEFQCYYFLSLVKTCYPERLVIPLFHPLLQTFDPFSVFVWQHYPEVKNARQFARLANCSVRCFERRFKKKFDLTPGQWLLERKIESVHQLVVKSEEPLTSIADKYGFTTLAQFSDFCKKYLGNSPTKLRNDSKTRNK